MDIETKKMFEMFMKKLDNIEESQKEMKESQRSMEVRQDEMLESQRSMEIRQDEIFSVVKAIEHNNNNHKAEIDNISYKVAHIEGTINKVCDVILDRRLIK